MLHRRASDWFADHDEPSEAIRHAIAGHQFDRAAELVELTVPTLLRDRQEALLRGWIELLPEELLQVRPVLSNGYVAALLSTGTIEGVDRHLRYAERWLDGPDTGAEPEAPQTGWSSQTTRSSAGCRPAPPSTGPGWRWCWAIFPARWLTPSGHWPSSRRTTMSGVERPLP